MILVIKEAQGWRSKMAVVAEISRIWLSEWYHSTEHQSSHWASQGSRVSLLITVMVLGVYKFIISEREDYAEIDRLGVKIIPRSRNWKGITTIIERAVNKVKQVDCTPYRSNSRRSCSTKMERPNKCLFNRSLGFKPGHFPHHGIPQNPCQIPDKKDQTVQAYILLTEFCYIVW